MSLPLPIYKIFSCSYSTYLAKKIAEHVGYDLGKSSCITFSDGEQEVSYDETIRGSHCFIVQSTFPPSDNLMELLMMIDAAKRASAYKIIAVMPYFGYARQDRKSRPRVSIAARLVADMLMAAGVDRIITMDLHADQIQGFFNVPVDHMYASTVFVPYLQQLNLKNPVLASPDAGGSKRANSYAKILDTDLVICHKTRESANKVSSMTVIGDVHDKDVILVDDMIDTAGTVCRAAEELKTKGANSVRVIATHPVLSGNAYVNIENSQIDELVVTDSIPLKRHSDKISVLSVAEMTAKAIQSVADNTSISQLFVM